MNDMGPASFRYMSTNQGVNLRWGLWKTTAKNHCGTMLLLSGRGEYLEKYQETVADLTQRGYDVYAFDWRGQGLSSRMLANRHKGFVHSYDDYLADLDYFVQTRMVPNAKAPFYLLAHSMGAHIGLRYLHDHYTLFQGAVLTAPLFDIAMSSMLKKALRTYVRAAIKLGFAKRYVPGANDGNPHRHAFENNKLTSDRVRFERMNHLLNEKPDLVLGGVTHQWLLATFCSIDRICAKGFVESIKLPVLIVAAGSDSIVSRNAQQSIYKRLPQCRLIILESAKHEILVEADKFRNQFWQALDEFI